MRSRSGGRAWGRMLGSVIVLVAVVVGVPVALVACARLSLGAAHPIPGLGRGSEIGGWITRDHSSTELVPVAVRLLLVVAWVLWAGLLSTLAGSFMQISHRFAGVRLPRLSMFEGLTSWIVAGITVVTTLAPLMTFVPTQSATAARPMVVAAASGGVHRPGISVAGESGVMRASSRSGFVTVQPAESLQTFAARVLGSGDRWSEIWELNRDRVVDEATGERWIEPWKVRTGWQLEIPSDVAADPAAPEVASSHVVERGDSYWAIAEDRLHDELDRVPAAGEVRSETLRLIWNNAPRLGYNDVRMIHPGDVVEFEAVESLAPVAPTPAETRVPPVAVAPTVLEGRDSSGRDDHATPSSPTVETIAEPVSWDPPAVTTDPVAASVAIPPLSVAPPVTPPVPPAQTVSRSTAGEQGSGTPWAVLAGGLVPLAVAGAAVRFARARRLAAAAVRPHQRTMPIPPPLEAVAATLVYRDVSDVTWMGQELAWLVRHLEPADRSRLTIQLVQLHPGRVLEVSFIESVSGMCLPQGWTSGSSRSLRLDVAHLPEELSPLIDAAPVVPALVTLGVPDEMGQVYLNLEAVPGGLNVVGDPDAGAAWVANVVWELAGGVLAEHSDVLLVDPMTVLGLNDAPGVRRVADAYARHQLAISDADGERTMLDRRISELDLWPPSVAVLSPDSSRVGWDALVDGRSSVVIAIGGGLPAGTTVAVGDGELSIPLWSLTVDAVGLTPSTIEPLGALIDLVSGPAVADTEVEIPAVDSIEGDYDDELDDDDDAWHPPRWSVTVTLFGEPAASRDGEPLSLKPLQLAALAFLAIYRDVSVDRFREALWGDSLPTPQRHRDVLSELRRIVGGQEVIANIEGDRIRAGDQLGCDLSVFKAVADRAKDEPGELVVRLRQMVEIAAGRPFCYPGSAAAYWRWVDLEYLHATWEHRAATSAYELATHRLNTGDAAGALAAAERGLHASPLDAALTEVLMKAYAELGSVETAHKVFESHDRALCDAELGGAGDETRRVLDRIRAASRTGVVAIA